MWIVFVEHRETKPSYDWLKHASVQRNSFLQLFERGLHHCRQRAWVESTDGTYPYSPEECCTGSRGEAGEAGDMIGDEFAFLRWSENRLSNDSRESKSLLSGNTEKRSQIGQNSELWKIESTWHKVIFGTMYCIACSMEEAKMNLGSSYFSLDRRNISHSQLYRLDKLPGDLLPDIYKERILKSRYKFVNSLFSQITSMKKQVCHRRCFIDQDILQAENYRDCKPQAMHLLARLSLWPLTAERERYTLAGIRNFSQLPLAHPFYQQPTLGGKSWYFKKTFKYLIFK